MGVGTETKGRQMEDRINIVRSEIESKCGFSIGWFVPASQCPSLMRFSPMAISDFLVSAVPSLSIGAANQYIWTMAFAEKREHAALALRNLVGLLPDDFGGTIDWTEEAE